MKCYKLIFVVLFYFFILLQINKAEAKNFTDNGNSTVTDNDTGLMWQQGEGGSKIWEQALTYCEALTLAGKSDWRLPNKNELMSLVDIALSSPALDTTFFPDVNSSYYWSSTTNVGFTSFAWNVNFSHGSVSAYGKSYGSYARCVRGGQ